MSTKFLRGNYRNQEDAIQDVTAVVNSHLRDDAQPERWDILESWPYEGSRPPAKQGFKGMTSAYSFISDSTNELFYRAELPRTYKHGTCLKPVVAWSVISGGAGSVKWGLEYIIQKPGAAYTQSTSIIYALTSATTATHCYLTATFASITASEMGSIILYRLFRDGSLASDNFGGQAYLLNMKFHILNDTSRGSQYEYTKFDR